MTLRADIRTAYDEITPAAPALESQIRTLVAAEPKRGPQLRHSRSRWTARLRGTIALVAAMLVVLIVATVLVGSRVIQDWNAFTRTAPAVTQPSELAQLEARPMVLPQLRAGDPCPETSVSAAPVAGAFPAGLYGSSPVYWASGSSVSDAWGTYWYPATVTDARLNGLVLVRAQDLETGQPVIYVGNWARGPVVAVDNLSGKLVQQHIELVLDTRHPPYNAGSHGFNTWGFTAGLAMGASGCTGWQIDTTGYATEVFVTRLTPG